MNPDQYLTLHQQQERTLVRELELRRAARDCAACVVRTAHRAATTTARARRTLARLTDGLTGLLRDRSGRTPACCAA